MAQPAQTQSPPRRRKDHSPVRNLAALPPAYVGPGVWRTIHLEAFHARTPAAQRAVVRLIRRACANLGCAVCRGHCARYIEERPPEAVVGLAIDDPAAPGHGLPLGLFVWTWEFHNSVNYRLGKALVEWAEVYDEYSRTVDPEL